jgi:hypothetical protein
VCAISGDARPDHSPRAEPSRRGSAGTDPPPVAAQDQVQAAGHVQHLDGVATAFQFPRQPRRHPAFLELRCAIPVADVAEGQRRGWLHAVVKHGHQGSRDIIDDATAAGRTKHGMQAALVIEYQGRRHRRHWPLSRFGTVGHRLAGRRRIQ